jgi:hypothetical protein
MFLSVLAGHLAARSLKTIGSGKRIRWKKLSSGESFAPSGSS